jgi:membrane protease YdiL (CAAX protease family)
MLAIRIRIWLLGLLESTGEWLRKSDDRGPSHGGIVVSALLFWLVCMAALQILMVFIGGGVWWLVLGHRPPIFTDKPDQSATVFLTLMGPLATLIAYIPVLALTPFIRTALRTAPEVRDHPKTSEMLAGAAGGIILFMIMQAVGAVFNLLAPPARPNGTTVSITTMVTDLIHGSSLWPVWTVLTIFIVIVLVPIAEEIMFRGLVTGELRKMPLIQDHCGRWGMVVANLVSGVIFAGVHCISAPQDQWPLIVVSMTIMGTMLSWFAYDRAHTIWPGVLAHIVYNALTLAVGVLIISV